MSKQKQIYHLCHSEGKFFYNEQFRKYSGCQSIFRCPEYFLAPDKEKSRYETHNNDVRDTRYQDFVAPIINNILKNRTPKEGG